MSERAIKILNLYYATHRTCNLDCSYCYIPPESRKERKTSDGEIIASLDRLIRKFENEGYAFGSFCLHGAEPSLSEPGTIAEIIRKVNEHWRRNDVKGKDVAIQTNGVRFTEDYLRRLIDLIESPKRFRIGFSIDPPRKVHDYLRDGSFDIAERNYETSLEMGFPTSILSVVSRPTIENINEFGDWMKKQLNRKEKFGEPYKVKVKFATGDLALNDEQTARFADYIYENKLTSLPQSLTPGYCLSEGNECLWYEFSHDGLCYSCNKAYYPGGEFADWFKESLPEIERKRKSLYSDYPTSRECAECPYEFLCNSGCPIDRVKNKTSGKAVDCVLIKRIFDRVAKSDEHIINFYNNNL